MSVKSKNLSKLLSGAAAGGALGASFGLVGITSGIIAVSAAPIAGTVAGIVIGAVIGKVLISHPSDTEEQADTAENQEEENLELLPDTDAVATKLDLARAYIDMGDENGATEILEEILEEEIAICKEIVICKEEANKAIQVTQKTRS